MSVETATAYPPKILQEGHFLMNLQVLASIDIDGKTKNDEVITKSVLAILADQRVTEPGFTFKCRKVCATLVGVPLAVVFGSSAVGGVMMMQGSAGWIGSGFLAMVLGISLLVPATKVTWKSYNQEEARLKSQAEKKAESAIEQLKKEYEGIAEELKKASPDMKTTVQKRLPKIEAALASEGFSIEKVSSLMQILKHAVEFRPQPSKKRKAEEIEGVKG